MKRLVPLLAAVLALSGCSSFTGIYDIPLPGGADLGDHPYTVKAHFKDVLDLVPQSGVKVNEVPVGRVEDIQLAPDGWTAEVTMRVNGDVELPANALAMLRQSSLLGEKYVELSAPPQGEATGRLADDAVIPLARTNRNTDIEEVLGALSMLLNGGGVEQLQSITKELNAALEGKEPDLRATLTNLDTLVGTLDESKSDIVRAIDGVNQLAGTLASEKDELAGAIDSLGPGLQVLNDQRSQLVTMLQSLDSLSDVAVDTVNASQADIVADLKALTPALQKLGEAGADLPKSLELLLTIPFSDEAVNGIEGDYFNLYAKIDLNLQDIVDNLSRSRNNPLQNVPVVGDILGGQSGGADSPLLPIPIIGGSSSGQQQQPPADSGGLGGLLGGLLGGGK
ncbi:MCE family protein [Actinophytocola oryzae]|uniref:Phospholipid/cholesterol/gamma-HCH transport system substrate-binding protein n=1 Tax=Actinophytocola oryzae TaxID=502181 RepID=A0A4R7V9E6_9PSEU|nr:MCE family protein [Actinophytocola oryzae]TDV45563.1 phospholipid/cholesterol/gamma-HCH transport system substrate-binding protein [Actinophytocola oryzae]